MSIHQRRPASIRNHRQWWTGPRTFQHPGELLSKIQEMEKESGLSQLVRGAFTDVSALPSRTEDLVAAMVVSLNGS